MNIIEWAWKRPFKEKFPTRFYIENVRSYFDTNYSTALAMINEAIRQGWIEEGTEFYYKNEGIALSRLKGQEIPQTVEIYVEEEDDYGYEPVIVPITDLKSRKFYQHKI
jgi:hypothetical protein